MCCGGAGGTLLPSSLNGEILFCPFAIPQDQNPGPLYLRLGSQLLRAHHLPAFPALSLVGYFGCEVLVSSLSHLSRVLPVCDSRFILEMKKLAQGLYPPAVEWQSQVPPYLVLPRSGAAWKGQ